MESEETVMEKELLKKCGKYREHFQRLMDIECAVLDITEEPRLSSQNCPGHFCTYCGYEKKDEIATHVYGCNEAYRWNGTYIYYCPAGLVFVAAAVSDRQGSLCGALLQGPFVMGPMEDLLLYFPYKDMLDRVGGLTVLTPEQVTDLSEIMGAVTAQISGSVHRRYDPLAGRQQKVLNTLYDVMEKYDDPAAEPRYPVEAEKRLQQLIRSGDREGSMELLNQILGDIYFISGFDLDRIKARVLELLILISRTAMEAGADAGEIFRFNEDNIRRIECMEDIEQLSMWLNRLLLRFISSSFEAREVKHADIIHKTIHFVRQNYQKKLSLEEIAEHVCLSKSYLSTIFRDEMKLTLTSYINQVRVEKSKTLLLRDDVPLADVALMCGFEDQSYYTKIFRRATGTSPKKYRSQGGGG